MRKLLLMLILLTIVPVNATMINEPTFKFKVKPWLKALDISEDGKITVCGNDKFLYIFRDAKILWKKEIKVNCLEVSGNYVAVGDTKGEIWLFSVEGKLLWKKKIGGYIESIAVSPNGFLVVGSYDHRIHYLNRDGRILWVYEAKSCVASVDVCDNGSFVVAEDMLGNVYFFTRCSDLPWRVKSSDGDLSWIYNTGWCVWKYSIGTLSYPNAIRISADGRYIAVNGGDIHEVYMFSRDGYIVWKCRVDGLSNSMATTADGSYLVIGCDTGYVYLFDRYGRLLWKFNTKSDTTSVDISSDGKFIAVGSGSKVYLFDGSSRIIWMCDIGEPVKFVRIADNGRVVVGCTNGLICFFKSTIKPIAEFDYDPKDPKTGEVVTFRAKGTGIVEYIWDFGDGSIVKTDNATVTHMYSKPGIYVVRLTVKNEDGLTNSTSRIITVKAKDNPPKSDPRPTLRPTPTPTKSGWLPIQLPKIPGFKVIYGIVAMIVAYVIGRKR